MNKQIWWFEGKCDGYSYSYLIQGSLDVCSGLSLPSDSDFWGDGYFDDDDDDDNTTQHNTTQHC